MGVDNAPPAFMPPSSFSASQASPVADVSDGSSFIAPLLLPFADSRLLEDRNFFASPGSTSTAHVRSSLFKGMIPYVVSLHCVSNFLVGVSDVFSADESEPEEERNTLPRMSFVPCSVPALTPSQFRVAMSSLVTLGALLAPFPRIWRESVAARSLRCLRWTRCLHSAISTRSGSTLRRPSAFSISAEHAARSSPPPMPARLWHRFLLTPPLSSSSKSARRLSASSPVARTSLSRGS